MWLYNNKVQKERVLGFLEVPLPFLSLRLAFYK